MSDIRLKMSPPWITYVNELNAMFGNDREIGIVYDNARPAVTLTVENPEKAAALAYLLPELVYFGGVDLEIVIDGEMSNRAFPNKKELFDIAFENNPIYAFSHEVKDVFSNSIVYVVFKNRVVQFFNDNLSDIYGNVSTLYEDIADDLFEDCDLRGVFFCTDIEEKVGKPLGEWP